ncbi:MAG: hypothetical protein IJG13_05660 [Kiritimatiellae bacterium]|nr:hypothetical protein [Kiritimatiellia bacterium]MBQ6328156.1 hypothetical protein [Kiritimatiellia bacterium]
MKGIAKKAFCKKLVEGHDGYTEVRAERIYEQLSAAAEDIQSAAMRWIESGEEPVLSEAGWSVARLEAEMGMNALAAVLTIDWLRKAPAAATAALKEGIK